MALGISPSSAARSVHDAGRRIRKILAALVSLLLAGALAACGLGTAGGYTPSGTLAGPIADIDLDGATVSVGSKNFTEQIILGKMAVSLFESAGAQVQDLTNAPGSNTSREAMLSRHHFRVGVHGHRVGVIHGGGQPDSGRAQTIRGGAR